MKQLLKLVAISMLVLSLVPAVTLAQTRTTSAPPSQDVPGAVSLFFRDLNQRMQLWFTFNEESDTDLRVQFASDNLHLANIIASAQLGSTTDSKASKLVERAAVLSEVVSKRLERWQDGNEEVKADLVDSVEVYFGAAEDLLRDIAGNITNETDKTKVTDAVTALRNQRTTVAAFIESRTAARTPDASGIVRPVKAKDKDRDGIDDAAEADLGLSSENFDTDGDGLSDRVELEKYGTDPNSRDSDNDGYTDAVEVLQGYNPMGTGNRAASVTTSSLKFINVKLLKPQLKAETTLYLKAVVKNYEVKKN